MRNSQFLFASLQIYFISFFIENKALKKKKNIFLLLRVGNSMKREQDMESCSSVAIQEDGLESPMNDVGFTRKTIEFPLIFANHKFHNSIVLTLNERFLQTHSNLDNLEFHLPTLPPSLPTLIIATCLVPLHKRSHLLPPSFLSERT